MTKTELKKYAELLILHGVNLQKKQMLVISAPINANPLVVELVKAAYKHGASNVEVEWESADVAKLGLKNKTLKELKNIPNWAIEQKKYFIERRIAYIGIISDDPDIFKSLKAEKVAAARRARSQAFDEYRSYMSSNKLRWCLAGYPEKSWAKKMFPDLKTNEAMKKQWEYIAKSVRLDSQDPIEEWNKHQQNLANRCKILNESEIVSFHYKNSLGTDFTVGMPEGYIFCGGAEYGELDGVPFTANMPTEEVFSCPDRNSANGRLVAAMPLSSNGKIIKDFYLDFKNGRIVDFGAKEGYDTLKSIIETDEGSHYLGEIALIGYNSPIRALNTLFYETLYDENASCHFAIGDCYPTCLKGGANMSEEELLSKGLNSSFEHVDFMVGTKDLSITAKTKDGKEMKIFENGDWVI